VLPEVTRSVDSSRGRVQWAVATATADRNRVMVDARPKQAYIRPSGRLAAHWEACRARPGGGARSAPRPPVAGGPLKSRCRFRGSSARPDWRSAHSAHRDQAFRAIVIARSGHRDRSEATLAWSTLGCWVPFAWTGPLALSGGPGGRGGRRWRRRGWGRPGSRATPW
jgi:hypothetical protein